MDVKMEQQELMMELYRSQEQSKEIEEKMKIVEQQLTELQQFSNSLEELNENKSKEMLASLGKGVYIKSKVQEGKLFVDVGSGILLRKSITEAKEVVKDQVKKLGEMKIQLVSEGEALHDGIRKLVADAEKAK
jgi:prefoldin alpha subunit